MTYLVDSSVFLRTAEAADPLHQITMESMQDALVAGASFCVSSQIISECWNVFTRPVNVNGFGFSPQAAKYEIERLLLLYPYVDDPQNLGLALTSFAEHHQVLGRQIHDARLALTCELLGLHGIVSYNKPDFKRYLRIQIFEPRELAQNLK